MRIEEREESIIKTVFVANDGEEFTSEIDCKKHEYCLENEVYIEKLKYIEHATSSYPPTLGDELNENNYFDWYKPKNKDEIETLNRVFSGIEISEECLDQWICIEHFEETEAFGSDNYVSQLNMSIDYVKQLFDRLGYDVEFKERNEK